MPTYEYQSKRPNIAGDAFVHDQAVLIGDVEVGSGCYIAACCVLRGDFGRIVVGPGSNIQDGCVVHSFPDETALLGPGSHIAHGAIVHGGKLGRHAVVGMNAVVLDFAELGDDCVIGSGAVVPARTKVPPRTLMTGIPAKPVRELKPDELEKWMAATRAYQELARTSLATLKRL